MTDDLEMHNSEYYRENNGTTGRHGDPADCQLAMMNIVEVQMNIVAIDKT